MAEFNTTVFDENDNEIHAVVHYNFVPPRLATHWEPSEGGVEIEDVVCPVKLSKTQMDRIEQEAVDYAWAVYRGEVEQ